jgi:hypothetical protein
MEEFCDDCQQRITTPCGRCHCDRTEDYCKECRPESPFFQKKIMEKSTIHCYAHAAGICAAYQRVQQLDDELREVFIAGYLQGALSDMDGASARQAAIEAWEVQRALDNT